MRRRLEARKAMNDAIRRYFDGLDFLEVETPVVVASPGMEPHLVAMRTGVTASGFSASPLYLHTSPEYAMKKLLGRGVGDCYQIARVFRDEPVSRTHLPEFTMLEWYRSAGTLERVMADTEALVALVAAAVGGPFAPTSHVRLSVSEAFARCDLPDPLSFRDVEAVRRSVPFRTASDDTLEDIFHRAMLELVEPSFDPGGTTILYGYPASMAALSRIDPEDPRRCLRFEVYAGGLELGNAFDELTDPVEQRARFVAERELRRTQGLELYPVDEALLDGLSRIDRAAGIALGLDRLLMVCLGARAIQDVVAFALEGSNGSESS